MRLILTIIATALLTLSMSTAANAAEINPHVELDTTQIDDLRVRTEPQFLGKILIPTDANPETTPTILVDGYWIPEESPTGTYPTGEWLDNSPVYSGHIFLQVNDSTGIISWKEINDYSQLDFSTVTPVGK